MHPPDLYCHFANVRLSVTAIMFSSNTPAYIVHCNVLLVYCPHCVLSDSLYIRGANVLNLNVGTVCPA